MDDIKEKVKDVIDKVTGGDETDEMDARKEDREDGPADSVRRPDEPFTEESPALVVPPQGGLPGIAPTPDPSIEPEGLGGDRDDRRERDSGF